MRSFFDSRIAPASSATRRHLDTTVGQTAAQALYRNHGYTETRRTQLGRFEVILFAKSIRPRAS